MNEISILRHLKHPNIINLYEVYEGEDYVHLVFELIKGGELQAKIKSRVKFTEPQAALLMHKLLETVFFCHANGYIHRDIKPANLIQWSE